MGKEMYRIIDSQGRVYLPKELREIGDGKGQLC